MKLTQTGVAVTNGSTTMTVADTTNIDVGDVIFASSGFVPPFSTVVSIDSGTTLTMSDAATGSASGGTATFNALPGENPLPEDGIRLKVKMVRVAAASSTAITSITIYTDTTDASRARTYSLDPTDAQLVLTGLQDDSEVRVYRTSDDTELAGIEDSSGGTFTYDYTWEDTDEEVYIVIHHLDYLPIRYEGQMLGQNGLTLPIQQVADRQYLNP
jgi:hypothetical protein